jgi:hypothetical protein
LINCFQSVQAAVRSRHENTNHFIRDDVRAGDRGARTGRDEGDLQIGVEVGHKHGGPTTTERHEGDLGNIEADSSGKAHIDWKGQMSMSGADSIIGKSVVVHEKEDDLKTDPSGNSGARLACGAIEAAK